MNDRAKPALRCIAKLIGVILAGYYSSCLAAPPADRPLDMAVSAWFKGLRQPNTHFPCCDIADCRKVEFRRTPSGAYQANIAGRWYDVPDGIVITDQLNPTSSAIACYTSTSAGRIPDIDETDRKDHVTVHCFVPVEPAS